MREIRRLQKEGMLAGHLPIIAVTANARGELQSVSHNQSIGYLSFADAGSNYASIGEQIAAAKDSGMVSNFLG